ncbi:glycerol-3-phosphate acyltransferase 3 isoform X1 [Toxorhynchites rutilus septentrionalis]|uniref:glycerol-3-phosphate acyltransferase 3 isoform X1 n=1 Tax=Toxorhynchites rutilus septentrionalis TaxID=329112 RepID=UPI00247A4ADA|nr:glycerol-3-phosphate acyltransferase 3 isoform X1 [Toxorhynchites rutilus septentrionalis]
MMLLDSIGSVFSVIALKPIIMLMFFVIFLASIGKSIGVRRMYVNMLVRIFEYGRQNIESVRKLQYSNLNSSDVDEVALTTKELSTDSIDQSSNSAKINNVTKLNGVVTQMVNGDTNNGNSVISRVESLILLPGVENCPSKNRDSNQQDEIETLEFNLSNCLDYVKSGMEAIIEDEVTSRFEAEELKNWNLLTRTNRHYEFISLRLTVIWVIGFFIRYVILMPCRVFICFVGVVNCVVGFAIVGLIPNKKLRIMANDYVFKHTFRIFCRSLSAVIRFHSREYKPKNCGFCVANHTTPIDVAILSTDHSYSLIGQRHGGFLGILQRALARASPHIWFERAEAKDRMAVARRLKEHVSDPTNPPILIFPEGTCINNTSVMQFKKGSFEVGGVIYPVAIKYDARFGDAFWNSSRFSMLQYLYMMMTSWAIVCDVWYLPPMTRNEDESAIDFANRVKSVIAKQGGLVDLVWDGQLKRMKPKKEWKEKQQEEFTKRLKGE